MPKKPRDVHAEYEKAVKEFEAQGDPAAWICFYWPEFHRWQAVAAYDAHRELAGAARALALEARQLYGDKDLSESALAGDCANALASMVLEQREEPRMGGMLIYISDVMKLRFLFAVIKTKTVGGAEGNVIDLQEMVGVTNVEQAKRWVNAHPGIQRSKAKLMADLLKGPQH